MTVHPLAATGVDNWDTPLVTYGDVWNDNSDGTYGPLSYVDGTKVNVRGYLAAYSGETVASITLHFRASASGDATDQPIAFEFDRDTGGRVLMFYGGSSLGRNSDSHFFGPGATFAIPTDGVIRDYTSVVDSHTLTESGWDDLDELLGDLQSGTGWLYAWADDYLARPPSPAGAVRIYEAWLEVATVEVDPTAPVPPGSGGSEGGPGGAPDPDAPAPTAPGVPGPPAPGISGGYLTPGNRRGAPTEVEVLVDGHWLSLECRWDTPTWSHTWPGGSANASWTASGIPSRLTRVGLLTGLRFAGEPIWSGVLNEADDAEGQMNARGLFSLGLDFAAIDSDGNATTIPDVAVDAAIVRGLRWLRRASLSDEEQDVDISSGPVKVSELLDAYATDAGVRWGVDPYGYVYSAPDPTTPTWHLLGSLDELLTPSDDGIATALIGRYRTSGGYASTPPVIAEAEQWLGYSEDTVDLTARGVIDETKAIAKLRNILKLARAVPTWANPLVLGRGDLMTAGQVPAALETARAGQLLRVHSQLDPRQGGQGYSDVLAGDTEVADGQLTWTPLRAPARSIPDIVAELMNRTRGDSRG